MFRFVDHAVDYCWDVGVDISLSDAENLRMGQVFFFKITLELLPLHSASPPKHFLFNLASERRAPFNEASYVRAFRRWFGPELES